MLKEGLEGGGGPIADEGEWCRGWRVVVWLLLRVCDVSVHPLQGV